MVWDGDGRVKERDGFIMLSVFVISLFFARIGLFWNNFMGDFTVGPEEKAFRNVYNRAC